MLALCGLLLLAACGGSGGGAPAPATGPVEACSLVTQEEVADALGVPVGEPESDEFGGEEGGAVRVTTCSFGSSSLSNLVSASILARESTPEEVTAAFQSNRSQATSPEPVSGLGEDAFWSSQPPQMHILKGNVYLIIQTRLSDQPGAFDEAKELAKKAVKRLR